MGSTSAHRRRWRSALALWALCTTAGLAATVRYSMPDIEISHLWMLAALAFWLFIALRAAADIQRRPPEAMVTAFVSAIATVLAGTLWMGAVLSMRGRYGLWLSSQPYLDLGASAIRRWYLSLALIVVLPACVSVLLLFKWMSLSRRIAVIAATTLLTPLVCAAVAELPSMTLLPRALFFSAIATHTAVILAWACAARPCGWEWLYSCRGCGYDLRGIEADRCPECGQTASSKSDHSRT